jgi:type IV secretory pathway TraG/TraD family ATPase VirD4
MVSQRRINESFEGFETWHSAFRMSVKMHAQIFAALLAANLVCFAVAAYLVLGSFAANATASWLAARALTTIVPSAIVVYQNPDGSRVRTTARALADHPGVKRFAGENLKKAGWVYLFSTSVFLLWPLVLSRFKKRSRAQSGKKFLRGSRIITAARYNRKVKRQKIAVDLPFGTVKMPRAEEVKHTFIIGRPGSGKTQLLTPILKRLKQRGERAVVYDYKGDYVAKFYNPAADLIFNPLDRRSVGWNVFNEVTTPMDIEAMGFSLIPPAAARSDPFWSDAARGVFSGILHYLYAQKETANRAIWEQLTADSAQIAACLKSVAGGEAGFRYIEDAGSRQAMGVLAVMMQHTRCFEYMAGIDGDFSIGDWIENGHGMIFITNYADVQGALRPILSLFIDLLARRLLSMADDYNRRIFFLLDEFGTLQRLDAMVNLLTGSRSKGGSIFLGVQDIGQIDRLYSKDTRMSIVNACGNAVIFAVADPDNARYLSSKISDTEYTEMEKSYSMGVEDFRDGVNLSQRKRKEPLFLPADLMSLPDMTGIVKFANHDYLKTTLSYTAVKDVTSAFELRPDLRMENIAAENGAEEATVPATEGLDIAFEGI